MLTRELLGRMLRTPSPGSESLATFLWEENKDQGCGERNNTQQGSPVFLSPQSSHSGWWVQWKKMAATAGMANPRKMSGREVLPDSHRHCSAFKAKDLFSRMSFNLHGQVEVPLGTIRTLKTFYPPFQEVEEGKGSVQPHGRLGRTQGLRKGPSS